MSALSPPPPNASPTKRGLVSKGPAEQAFAGPKRFVNDTKVDATLTVGADWEAEFEGESGPISLRGLPLQIGGFLSDLSGVDAPGYRHYELELPGGGPPIRRMILGAPELQFDWDFDGSRVSLNGQLQATALYVNDAHVAGTLTGGAIDVAGPVDAGGGFFVNGVPFGGGGVDSVGAFGNTPNSGGASVSGSTLTLQPADASNPGGVSVGDQQLGGSSSTKTFGNILVTSLATIAAAVTSLVRAVGAALVLRSDVGALSTDVAVKVGTSVADGSTHASAKLLAGYTGLGGTEVEKFSFTKDGTLRNTSGYFCGASASGYLLINDVSGAVFSYASNSLSVVGGGLLLSAGGGGVSALAATTISFRSNRFNNLFSLGGDVNTHICNYFGSGLADGVVHPNATLGWFGTGIETGTQVRKSYVTARGTYGIAGTLGSTVGDQTINAAKGRASIGAGESEVTITNDQVTADSVVMVVWEEAPCDQTSNALVTATVVPSAGSFTVALWREFEKPAIARADHSFRFVVIQ